MWMINKGTIQKYHHSLGAPIPNVRWINNHEKKMCAFDRTHTHTHQEHDAFKLEKKNNVCNALVIINE